MNLKKKECNKKNEFNQKKNMDCNNCNYMEMLEKSIALNKQIRRQYIEFLFTTPVLNIQKTPLKLTNISLN